MANPQKEEGYTAIANEIMDALCHIRIPGEERQVLDCILRKTYGWNKCEDAISLSQFMEMTGLKKPTVCRAINRLLSKKIIQIIEKDNEPAKLYKFIKDYHQWKRLSKKITLSKKIIGVIKKDNKTLSLLSTTKDTTKDTIQKTIYSADFLKFYSAYPNRKEKIAAFKAWKKLNGQRPSIDIILLAIQNQINWRKNINKGDFVAPWKNPATWLNKGCWEDELKSQGGNNGNKQGFNSGKRGYGEQRGLSQEAIEGAERINRELESAQAAAAIRNALNAGKHS